MALADYKTGDFSQGTQLRAQYPYNSELYGGICFSLMVQWFKELEKNSDPYEDSVFGGLMGSPSISRMDSMKDALTLAGTRQRIYTQAVKQGGAGWGSNLAATLTSVGRHWGWAFAYSGSAPSSAAFANHFSNPLHASKQFYMSLKFVGGGGHAVGCLTSDPMIFFDPNFGEFQFTTAQAGAFFGDLWTRYGGVNGGIGTAHAYEATRQQSLVEFWQARA
jgi:hypothetical protein